jgi:small subunit ribosomal protein S20
VAHTRSAKKSIGTMQDKRARNRSVKRTLKTFVAKADALIEEGDREAAGVAVEQARVKLEKAAQKGIIHRNNAARSKSRLTRRFNVAFPPG